jgi:hypothetical protein
VTSTAANGTIRFPAFSDEHFQSQHEESPYGSDDRKAEASPTWRHSSNNAPWAPRRYSNRQRWAVAPTSSAAYPSHSRHIRQKSLSEALHNIRTRSGSVSQNAMEIADALKAPVSYKVVVCISRLVKVFWMDSILINIGSLLPLVHSVCWFQHNIERSAQLVFETRNSYPYAIHICLLLVLDTRLDVNDLSNIKTLCGFEERHKAADPSHHSHHIASYRLHDWRPHPQQRCHIKDTSVARPYNQRPLSSLYRPRIQALSPPDILGVHIRIPRTAYSRSHVSMQHRFQCELSWLTFGVPLGNRFCNAKHGIQENLRPGRRSRGGSATYQETRQA